MYLSCGVPLSRSCFSRVGGSHGQNSLIQCRSLVQYQLLVISPCCFFSLSCEFQLTEQAIGVHRPSTGTGHSHVGSYVAPVLYIIYIYITTTTTTQCRLQNKCSFVHVHISKCLVGRGKNTTSASCRGQQQDLYTYYYYNSLPHEHILHYFVLSKNNSTYASGQHMTNRLT